MRRMKTYTNQRNLKKFDFLYPKAGGGYGWPQLIDKKDIKL